MGKPNTGKRDKKGWAKKKEKHGGSARRPRQQSRGTEDDDGSDFEEVGQSSEMRTGVYFSESDSDGDANNEKGSFEQEQKDTRQLVQQQNRKKKKSGGFQSMGLSHPVFKGVLRKGYKVPTPIQRKTIPVIMDGRDVVAMARTGSGKTAAFLIPMFERLKAHTAKAGARAMILSPTRELALQTLKFAKELGKYTGLRAAVILGGDSMEDQFAALHENPDIIIATPGRFMHVLVEMELRLEFVEYVVFDEADRLFEMGFQEQLHEILQRLPEARQTLLFSATLPRLLVEFAKAGLHDPMLVRLDVDTKLSENLQLAFLQCRSEDKAAVLLHLLRNVLKPSEQAVIFTATKHHVEYLNMLLGEAGIECSYSYSALDPLARKINVAKFRNKKTMVLLVTDLAARGIDIPMLDVVINYNFPAKPKLFVHRVGRVARAGRTGTAYSIVGPDEVPFVLDLHLFLGRPMKYASSTSKEGEDGLYGMVPQRVVDEGDENLQVWHQKLELSNMKRVITNAYKQYVRSRPAPSAESVKRMKATDMNEIAVHPVFGQSTLPAEQEREKMLNTMRTYRPNTTIFETSSTKKTQASEVMKSKRQRHGAVIMENLRRAELKKENIAANSRDISERSIEVGEDIDLQEVFSDVVAPRVPSGNTEHHGKKKRQPIIDEENYLSYRPKDFQSEKGLSLGTSFEQEAASAAMDLVGDEDQHNRKIKSQMKWDRKRKRFVRESDSGPGKKKVKTESGTWIKASYKSNLYKEWLNRSKAGDKDEDSGDEDKPHQSQNTSRLQILGSRGRGRGRGFRGRGEYRGTQRQPDRGSERGGKSAGRGRGGHGKPQRGRRYHNELKSSEEILHKRRKTAKLRSFMKFREQKHKKTKSVAGKKK